MLYLQCCARCVVLVVASKLDIQEAFPIQQILDGLLTVYGGLSRAEIDLLWCASEHGAVIIFEDTVHRHLVHHRYPVAQQKLYQPQRFSPRW